MVVITPSDIIDNPNLNLVNKNIYGNVKTNLHNVYPLQDDKVDISLSLTLTDVFGKEYVDKDLVTFIKLQNYSLSTPIIQNDVRIGYISDLGTFISNKSINTSGAVTAGGKGRTTVYKEIVYKKLKIDILKSEVPDISIESIRIYGNYKKAKYEWGSGSIYEQFDTITNKNINNITPTKTIIDQFLDIKNIASSSFDSDNITDVQNTFIEYNESDKFIIEIDVPIQYIESTQTLRYYLGWKRSVDGFRTTAETITIDFYNTSVNNTTNETASTVILDKDLETFTLEDSELTQVGATLNDKDLFTENASTILTNYINGRQTAVLKCKIKEYADERGYIQKDPVNGDVFEFGDIVSLYVDNKGEKVPLSTYSDNSARVFKVSASDIVYDNGKTYNEISVIETIPYLLNIDVSTVAVYRDGQQLLNGDYIYEGDTLTIYTSSQSIIVENNYVPENSSIKIFVTGSVYIEEAYGLFDESDNLIYSWDNLVYNNYITLDSTGGKINGYSCPTSGYLRIPDNVWLINNSAFENCTTLKGITSMSNVSTIMDNAFANSTIESINLPSGLEFITYRAFYKCNNLTSIEIPSSVQRIGDEAFYNCTSIITAIIRANIYDDPRGDYIGESVFSSCSSLKYVYINENLAKTGKGMFAYCTKLIEVYLSDYVKDIDNGTFEFCTSLKTINLTNSLERLGNLAFSECYELSGELDLNSTNITSIGNACFRACVGLTGAALPDHVESIGEMAFDACSNILYYYGTGWESVPTLGADAFIGINSNCKIYVNSSVYSQIVTATNWSAYASYITTT